MWRFGEATGRRTESACGELPVVVTVKSLNGERVPSHCLSYAAQVTLGYGKGDINRLDLRDDDERRRRTGNARRASESIRTELSRHRLGSARAKLAATTEKLAACSGRVSQAIAQFLSGSVGDPDKSATTIADEWTALLYSEQRQPSVTNTSSCQLFLARFKKDLRLMPSMRYWPGRLLLSDLLIRPLGERARCSGGILVAGPTRVPVAVQLRAEPRQSDRTRVAGAAATKIRRPGSRNRCAGAVVQAVSVIVAGSLDAVS
jgi:hypothetical protein